MKDLIKEVALEMSTKLLDAYLLNSRKDYSEAFATAFLTELSKRAEAVAWMQISVEEGVDTKVPRSNKPEKFNPEWWKFEPLFSFPPIHDIEAIENRVAEACAKICMGPSNDGNIFADDCAEAIRSGEWRKYK